MSFCYVIYEASSNKALKNYPYQGGSSEDRERASALAIEFAEKMLATGYPCLVEHIGVSGVGVLILDQTKPKK